MKKNGNFIITIISLVIFLLIAITADWSELPDYLASNSNSIFLFSILFIILFFLRILRNYLLLRLNSLTLHKIWRFLPPGMIGGTVATFGPFKTGELVTMELYQQYLKIDRGKSLAVIAVGRGFDVMSVLVLVFSSIVLIPNELENFHLLLFVLILSIIILFSILFSQRIGIWILKSTEFIFRWKLEPLYNKIYSIAEQYYESLNLLNNKRSLCVILIMTLSRWILEVFLLYIIFHSFSIDITILQVAPIIGFSYAIGVSSGVPGGIGVFQLTALSILITYGISNELASLSLIVSATLSIGLNIFLGFIGLVFSSIQIQDLLELNDPDSINEHSRN